MIIAYPDFWPFFSRSQNGTMHGSFHDILDTALRERMNIDVEWKKFPWKRCQLNVQNGKADAMITVPTAERLKYSSTHPHPFYKKTMNVFTYAGHPKMEQIKAINSIDDILKNGLSVITYAGNGWNDKYIRSRKIPIIESYLRDGVWNMLAFKRGDIIIEWPNGAWPDIEKQQVTNMIVQTDVVLESMPFHLLIENNSTFINRLQKIAGVLEQMQKDGTIAKIMKKYSS